MFHRTLFLEKCGWMLCVGVPEPTPTCGSSLELVHSACGPFHSYTSVQWKETEQIRTGKRCVSRSSRETGIKCSGPFLSQSPRRTDLVLPAQTVSTQEHLLQSLTGD